MQEEVLKFYRCNHCGNLFFAVVDSSVRPVCCGEEMEILVSRHDDSESNEKHVPIITKRDGDIIVQVGAELHPMTSSHRIEWVALTDGHRVELQRLGLTTTPIVHFCAANWQGNANLRAYAFCNLHGLWSSLS